jgi:D-sedoheptulose 7-phosphate isomerase
MDHSGLIQTLLKSREEALAKLISYNSIVKQCSEVSQLLVDCFKSGGKVMICGNGGSAADAQHLAAELSGRFYLDRKPLPAEALHVNSSYLTAVANDISFEKVYSRLVEGNGKNGDILIALSTSGNSPNILRAVEQAKSMGIKTIGFTGKDGGDLKVISDIVLILPSDDTPIIQEMHIMLGHIICQIVEATLFKND